VHVKARTMEPYTMAMQDNHGELVRSWR